MATINLVDLSGGMNQHSSPDLIANNQSPLILNCNLDQDGNVATRTGTDLLVNVSGTGDVKGLGVQERVTGLPRLFWSANGNLYYYNNASYINEISALIATATVSNGANAVVISASAHGLATGDDVYLTTDGELPTGLTASTKYWAIYKDADEIYLATSYDNAIAGTKIATSSAGSGTHSLYKYTDAVTDGYKIDFCSFQGRLYYLGLGTNSTSVPSGITWTRDGTDVFNVTDR
jgi:hypothetical protein